MPRSWMLSIAGGFLSNSFLGEIPDLLGLQPLHGCGIVGSFAFPHVAGIVALAVNVRLQKL